MKRSSGIRHLMRHCRLSSETKQNIWNLIRNISSQKKANADRCAGQNEKHVKLRKNIGRIFRQYNIIEYKSPEDDLDIDDFTRPMHTPVFTKSDTETVDLIPADELTITFVCYHYPRNMLRKLEQDRKFSVEQQDSGIYYLVGDAIPIQLVIVPKLSKEHNYWLNNLRNDLKAGSEIKNFIESYSKNQKTQSYIRHSQTQSCVQTGKS